MVYIESKASWDLTDVICLGMLSASDLTTEYGRVFNSWPQ